MLEMPPPSLLEILDSELPKNPSNTSSPNAELSRKSELPSVRTRGPVVSLTLSSQAMLRLRLPSTKWPANSLKDVHSGSISPSQREVAVEAAVEVAVVASEEAVEVIEEAVEVASVEVVDSVEIEVADSEVVEDSVVEEEETEEDSEVVIEAEDVNQSDSKAAEKCYEHDHANQSSALEVNW